MKKRKAMLFDITKCVGCLACYEACKVENDLPVTAEDPLQDTLSDKTFTSIEMRGDYYIRKMCQHCSDPACLSVCPVGAFSKSASGAVLYDEKKCMGCRYCMQACPFQIPRFEWRSTNPKITKCIMCYDLVKNGEATACSTACPAESTIFGDYDDIVNEAKSRLENNPEQYHPHIYGLKEVGGTSVLNLSPVPLEKLGFYANLPNERLPDLTWNALEKIPTVVSVGGVMLAGFYWLTNRKNEIKREELSQNNNRHTESTQGEKSDEK
ncbi:MAG: 4Fe-4S ferredoxin [Chlorobiaceae bacterium]|nr:4Fe-4S ferredoxin [Chlorobiaceae bacterium]